MITAAEFRYFVRDAKLRDATVTAPVVERVFASSAVEVGGSSAGGEGKGEGDGCDPLLSCSRCRGRA